MSATDTADAVPSATDKSFASTLVAWGWKTIRFELSYVVPWCGSKCFGTFGLRKEHHAIREVVNYLKENTFNSKYHII